MERTAAAFASMWPAQAGEARDQVVRDAVPIRAHRLPDYAGQARRHANAGATGRQVGDAGWGSTYPAFDSSTAAMPHNPA
jgi:hypothetical protein